MDKPNEQEADQPKVDLTDVTVQDGQGNVIPMSDEDKPTGLPEGIETVEQLIDRYNDMIEQSSGTKTGDTQDETEEEPESDNDQEADGDEEELDERDARIKALEIKLHDQELIRQVGGEEEYDQLREWASKNIPEDELEFYNNVLESLDLAAKKLAVKAMQAIHRDAAGYEGKEVRGSSVTTSEAFKSEGELHEAMADPRYHRMDSIGEAYRAEVAKKAQALLTGPDVNGWF